MSILTRPASSTFGIANVNTPSANLADTLFASICVGRVMLRVNVVCPVDSRSTEILLDSGEAADGSVVRNLVQMRLFLEGAYLLEPLHWSVSRRLVSPAVWDDGRSCPGWSRSYRCPRFRR